MDNETEKELEQLRKLDKLRKLIQSILRNHLWMIIVVFGLILTSLLVFIGVRGAHSPTRYLARLTLCFHPKHQGKIGQYDDKYVLRILNRKSILAAFVNQEEAQKRNAQRRKVADNIQIRVDRKQPHSFSIELHAGSEQDAVTFINEFAEICIREYAQERMRDLRQWKELLEKEKKELYEKIQKCGAEITALTVPLQMSSPEKDYDRLRTRLTELQNTRTRLNYALDNLNRRKAELSREMAAVNPMLLIHRNEIKDFLRNLENLDREISQATELYTDENPKMTALHSRRKALRKRFDDFLREKQIAYADPQLIRTAETLSADIKALQAELENKQNEKQVLDGEIADCSKRFQLFNETQPRLQWLIQQRRSLTESMQRLDESISEINYMYLMVKEDLFINENAQSAVGNRSFSKKNLAICLFAALALTAFCASLLTLFEFFFGVVADARELILYTEFHYLGVLPTSEKMFHSAESEKVTFNTLLYKFQVLNPQVVFTGALPGAQILEAFFNFLEWSFAMEGKRMLIMNMVSADEFSEPGDDGEEADGTTIVTFSGGKCFLPVSSREFLIPSELELLKSDFKFLKERYDYIFIRQSFPLRRSKLFLEQIASLCDAALYAVGAGKTPRKSLRELLTLQLKIKIPVMTIMAENAAGKLQKDLELETES